MVSPRVLPRRPAWHGLLLGATALALAGCATVEAPRELALQMDATSPRYDTEPCRQARQEAQAFDDKIGFRAGTGLALGLMLGPIGLPIAASIDMQQTERRRESVARLKAACDGPLREGESTAVPLPLRAELQQLDAQRTSGQIDGPTYKTRREALMARIPATPTAPAAPAAIALAVGAGFVWQDVDGLTGVELPESQLVVSAVDADVIAFNDGQLLLARTLAGPRRGRPAGGWLAGYDLGQLTSGGRLTATYHPPTAEDEAVEVQLQVEAEEQLSFVSGAVRVWRARLSGHASYKGPYQTPPAWLGARMQGTVWIEPHSGLLLKAAVESRYPTYALRRNLLRTVVPPSS
jgi:hypothetical protein